MSGHKIIEGLKDAVAGNLSRVIIDGQTWKRIDDPIFDQFYEAVQRITSVERGALAGSAEHERLLSTALVNEWGLFRAFAEQERQRRRLNP